MPEHEIEIFRILPAKVDRLTHAFFQLSSHSVDLLFKCIPVFGLPSVIVIDVKVSLLLVGGVQLPLDSSTADFERANTVLPVVLKAPLYFQNLLTDKALHPLHHDHEIVSVFIHEFDVLFAEIATVQDKTHVFISIPFCLFQGVLQLRYIRDASRICLVEQRFSVTAIIGNRVVEDIRFSAML